MKKFYYSTDSECESEAFACVELSCNENNAAVAARFLLDEKYGDEIRFTPLNRKPPRAVFRTPLGDEGNACISWAAKPAKVKTGAGRPKGSCKPVELRRVSHTLTVLPKTKANLLKLDRGVVGAKLDELYG